jgi:hypothetical protein
MVFVYALYLQNIFIETVLLSFNEWNLSLLVHSKIDLQNNWNNAYFKKLCIRMPVSRGFQSFLIFVMFIFGNVSICWIMPVIIPFFCSSFYILTICVSPFMLSYFAYRETQTDGQQQTGSRQSLSLLCMPWIKLDQGCQQMNIILVINLCGRLLSAVGDSECWYRFCIFLSYSFLTISWGYTLFQTWIRVLDRYYTDHLLGKMSSHEFQTSRMMLWNLTGLSGPSIWGP